MARKRTFSSWQTWATASVSMSTASAWCVSPNLRFSAARVITRSPVSNRPTCSRGVCARTCGSILKSIVRRRPSSPTTSLAMTMSPLQTFSSEPASKTGRDHPARLMPEQQRLGAADGRLHASARFDDHEPLAVEPAFSGDKTGALRAEDTAQAIDQHAGFDRRAQNHADVADVAAPVRRCGPVGRRGLGLGAFGDAAARCRRQLLPLPSRGGAACFRAIASDAHRPLFDQGLPHCSDRVPLVMTARCFPVYCLGWQGL